MPARAKPAATSSGRLTPRAAALPARSEGKSTPGKQAAVPNARASGRKVAEVKPSSPPITTFIRAMRFLDSLNNFEQLRIVRYTPDNFNLERMRQLCKKLGDPQKKLTCVHVAGTKGKGSTCAMAAAMLRSAGYTVGLYASPHLVDVRERIRILRPDQDRRQLPQGEMISPADFARLTKLAEPHVSSARLRPTYFDVLTAIAFRYFADAGVDVVLLETGLGGRLDSTNVVEPLVSVVTPISIDHMKQLGPTLSHIAAEKAGIFKPGIPAVTCEQEPEAAAVLARVAAENNAPLRVLGTDLEFTSRYEASRMLGRHNRVCFHTPRSDFEHLSVPLLGDHQAVNCGLALAIIDELKAKGWKVTDEQQAAGLDGLKFEGRLETLRTQPTIVVDAAHNARSVEAALRAVGQHFTYDSAVVIFGCCNDKDVDGMLARLVAGADKVIFTRIESVRSSDPKELSNRYAEQFGKSSHVAESLPEALRIARRAATDEDLICITGSFYLVGTAKKLLADRVARGASATPPASPARGGSRRPARVA